MSSHSKGTWYILALEMHSGKHLGKCVPLCSRFLTPDDTQDLCVFCLDQGHACSVLKRAECTHCEKFAMKKLSSHLSLFSKEMGTKNILAEPVFPIGDI